MTPDDKRRHAERIIREFLENFPYTVVTSDWELSDGGANSADIFDIYCLITSAVVHVDVSEEESV